MKTEKKDLLLEIAKLNEENRNLQEASLNYKNLENHSSDKMISENNSRSVDVAFHQTALFLGPYLPINSNRIITQQEIKLLKIIKFGVII